MKEWKEHVKELEERQEEGGKTIPSKPDLVFRNKVVWQLYLAESDNIKAVVEEYRNDPAVAASDDEIDPSLDSDEAKRILKAHALQK